ncbi:MAG: hypothetical protein KKB31_01400 [Nanoarchaeota archaeon]|nr:hypothetical protein [Nanoarchaeota archaeon]
MVTNSGTQKIFFGKPPGTPWDAPGTYITPEGSISVGGTPVSGGAGRGGVSIDEKKRLEAEKAMAAKKSAEAAEKARQAQIKIEQELVAQRITQQEAARQLKEQREKQIQTEFEARPTTTEFVLGGGAKTTFDFKEYAKQYKGGVTPVFDFKEYAGKHGVPVTTPTEFILGDSFDKKGVSFIEPADQVFRELETKPSPKYSVDLFREAGRQFFFIDGSSITAVRTLAAPLGRFFSGRQGEDINLGLPQRGTYIADKYFLPFEYKDMTKFERLKYQATVDPELLMPLEYQAEIEAKRIETGLLSEYEPKIEGLQQDIQEKITAGDITLEAGESQLTTGIETFQKEYETEFYKRYEPKAREIELISRRFKQEAEMAQLPSFDVKSAAEIGAMIGGTLVGGFPAAMVEASVIASGLPKITGGETIFERGVGTLEVGIGFAGFGVTSKQAMRAVDVGMVEELQAMETSVLGEELISTPKGKFVQLSGVQTIGEEGGITTGLRMPIFQTGEKEFAIAGGKGFQKLRYFSFETGKEVKMVEQFKFGARVEISELVPKIKLGKDFIGTESLKKFKFDFGGELKGFKAAYGKGFVQRRGADTFKEFRFGGIQKDVDIFGTKYTRILGGRMKSMKLFGSEQLRKGGLIFKEAKGIFDIGEQGFIRKMAMQTPVKEDVEYIISGGKGIKTSLQKTFQLSTPPGLVSEIQKQIISPKEIFKMPTQKTFVTGGLITKTKQMFEPRMSFKELQKPFLTELQKPFLTGMQIQPQISMTQQKNIFAMKPRVVESLVGAQLLGTAQKLKTKQLQKQRLFEPLLDMGFDFKYPPARGTDFKGWFGFLPPLPMGIFEGKGIPYKTKRKLRRDPSYFGVYAPGLGIKVPKMPEALEMTGLWERAIIKKKKKKRK